MSVMNKALAQLVDKQPSSLEEIEKAHVEPVKSRPVWVWVVAGFGLSLAVGGWAVSQQAPQVERVTLANSQTVAQPTTATTRVEPAQQLPSPTQKLNQANVVVYRSTPIEKAQPIVEVQPIVEADVDNTADTETPIAVLPEPSQPAVSKPAVVSKPIVAQPILLASNASSKSAAPTADKVSGSTESSVVIEQMDMSKEKLAEKAISRATKAMDSNDFQNAVTAYSEALRYTPENESVRQKLAALYYGKGEVRKAFDLMQRGIELNPEGESLRIALAKLLMREQQTEAALTPLAYLPESVGVEYLSLRAALAQKSKQNEIALESYQKLTEKDANNGRWWLGLAIQQERSFMLEEAKTSYQKALTKVGVSIQSQAFIRNRLEVLNHLEENNNAN
ncbi:tetratricopeptide repeat protein [Vibrio ziniensis]|uniref:MSHA biogenesis protein MshN n=1 Tax=Vibrio ziniensis TaxID=2711221 RepID=A0A6G7CL81_9VIBR|nr:MSHA biogenesis protein MshN [Vibrio ziniensis]QIH42834.1 MSHA biogenesis protein MshN [Vibrio ziniensis]